MNGHVRETFVVVSVRDFIIIKRRYLAIQNIPYFLDGAGRPCFERSWHHDLAQHLQYLSAFTLAAPLLPLPENGEDLIPLEEDLRARLNLVPLPPQTSRLQALLHLPRTFCVLWRAIGQTEIVHSGIGGWPYPLGWLANLIAQLRGKQRLIIVESAAWRTTNKTASVVPLRKKVEVAVYEWMARYWCARADLSFYTQPAYLTQFHSNARTPAYLAPASWVNDANVLDISQARMLWESKIREPLRFLFAGRLIADKGVKILLQAAETLAAAGVAGSVHVIGQGPLRDEVIAAARTRPFGLTYFEPVPYGEPFLSFLQNYHAIVVPSISDEQPRIVFDAAARAVPILASDTDGLRPHVEDGRTGQLIRPGDPEALTEAMAYWAAHPALVHGFGMEALDRVRGHTHRAMHIERSRLIAEHFGAG